MLFNDKNLTIDGEYLWFQKTPYTKKMFIARFKHQMSDRRRFKKFLIENFTVEEYFMKAATRVPPLMILFEKGYISTNLKKALKSEGYPQTAAGWKQYQADKGVLEINARFAEEKQSELSDGE